MNYFYATVAIMAFAESLISIFVPIYFYQLGISIYKIIFFYFFVSFLFVILSYPGAKIVSKIGVHKSILFSTPFLIIYYVGLSFVTGTSNTNWLFYTLPLFLALRMLLYNFGYHLNYITHSNKKKRGREISFILSITVGMHLLAPLVGGTITYYFGFSTLYLIGSFLLILGALPIFLGKETYTPIKFTIKDLWKGILLKDRGSFVSFSAYAIESVIGRTIWPIFLLLILGTVVKTGILVTGTMILSLFVFYISGKITDKYDKIILLRFGTIFYFFAWVGRIFVDGTFTMFMVDTYKNATEKLLHIPWEAKTFDLAMKRGYFRFLVGREIIFNFIRLFVMPILMLIFYINVYPFLISFGIAALFSIGYMFLDRQ